MTVEEWRPIPGHEGKAAVSNQRNVKTLPHTVIRSNGWKYRVKGGPRRIAVDRKTSLAYVKLATGRRGRYEDVWIHRLMEQVWGDAGTVAA